MRNQPSQITTNPKSTEQNNTKPANVAEKKFLPGTLSFARLFANFANPLFCGADN